MTDCKARLFLCATMGFLVPVAAAAAAEQSPSCPSSPPTELHRFRDAFLANFKRIGLNTAPEDAQFLRLLVEISGAKRGVEIGTATGYGALHMGLGFERNGGELITIDINPKMVAAARANIAHMKLDKVVTVIEGDALKVIPSLTGTFDFVFIDAVKKDYLKYLKAIEPLLAPHAVIVADNVIRSAGEMQDFLELVQNSPEYRTVTIRASEIKKDGMAVIYRLR